MKAIKEVWRVRDSDGRERTVVTRASSARALDRAALRYARALQRLARR